MGLWRQQSFWRQCALVLLVIFCSVVFAHAFVPHDHPHEDTNLSLLPPVHIVSGDKLLFLLAPLFVLMVGVIFEKISTLLPVSLRFGVQTLRAVTEKPLLRLFARGILNPRLYS